MAWRTTWHIKPGHLADAIAMVTRLHDSWGPRRAHTGSTARVYIPHAATESTIIVEETWPSVEAHDQWWAGFNKTHEYAAFLKAWSNIVPSDMPEDVWEVVEWQW